MQQSAKADLLLSNGAEVNFKIGKDGNGSPVVSYLQISFRKNREIPQGGISATLLREITISEILSLWFQESSRSFLTNRDEQSVWQEILSGSRPSGRRGLPPIYYACLAYVYVRQCELTPTNPTAEIAQRLQVSPKTISTRLAQSRKIGVLTGHKDASNVTRAGGVLTPEGKKIITNFIKEKK